MNSPIQTLAGVVTEKFITACPSKAAEALESLATHEVLLLISSLKAQVIITLLNHMNAPKAAAVLRRLPMRQASYVLARLNVPQAAKLMKEFSAPYRERKCRIGAGFCATDTKRVRVRTGVCGKFDANRFYIGSYGCQTGAAN